MKLSKIGHCVDKEKKKSYILVFLSFSGFLGTKCGLPYAFYRLWLFCPRCRSLFGPAISKWKFIKWVTVSIKKKKLIILHFGIFFSFSGFLGVKCGLPYYWPWSFCPRCRSFLGSVILKWKFIKCVIVSIKKKYNLIYLFPFQVSWVRNVDSHMLFIGRDLCLAMQFRNENYKNGSLCR